MKSRLIVVVVCNLLWSVAVVYLLYVCWTVVDGTASPERVRSVGCLGVALCAAVILLTLLGYLGAALTRRRADQDAAAPKESYEARAARLRRVLGHDEIHGHAFVLLEQCVRYEQEGFEIRIVDPTAEDADYRVLRPTQLVKVVDKVDDAAG